VDINRDYYKDLLVLRGATKSTVHNAARESVIAGTFDKVKQEAYTILINDVLRMEYEQFEAVPANFPATMTPEKKEAENILVRNKTMYFRDLYKELVVTRMTSADSIRKSYANKSEHFLVRTQKF